MRVFKFFWEYLKQYKKQIIIAFILMLINAFLGMLNPYISGIIVDDVIVNGNKQNFIMLMLLLILGVLIKSIMRYLSLINVEKVSQNFLFDIRSTLYTKMQEMDFSFFDETKTGNIMTRITGDLQVIRNFVAGSATVVFESIFSFIFVMILMIKMNLLFTVILLSVTPFIGIMTFKMTKNTRELNMEWHDQITKLNSVVQENISGNKVVKAFSNQEFEIEKFSKENEGYREEYKKWVKIWKTYLPPINMLGGMMSVLVILVGGIMVMKDMLSFGQLVVFTGLVGTLRVPINMANWLSDQVQKFFISGEKVMEIMLIEPKIDNSVNSVDIDTIKGEIEFKNVSFYYDQEKVLDKIDLKINPGETMGIVGPTGSGKTTIVNLICRFYDCTGGEILIDGINIKKIDKKKLRDSITIAMQDTFLFSDTIEGNIAYGVPNADLSQIEFSAQAAGAHDFILKLSENYNTIVGERGVGLSGGQRQRVSLARSLLKDSPILILDDITSSVDVETEQMIQESLDSVYKGKTTIVISHRISSVKNCDKIICLNEGRIIEQGTHDELIKKRGYYYNVYAIQTGKDCKDFAIC